LQVGAAICYRAATTSSFELSTTARAVRIVGLGLWVAPCRGGVAWRFSIQRHRRWRPNWAWFAADGAPSRDDSCARGSGGPHGG